MQQELSRFYEFIRLLNQKDVESNINIERAVAAIADANNIGRIIGELRVNPTRMLPEGYYEKTVFYTSDDGFTKEGAIQQVFEAKEPGNVTVTAYPRPHTPFSEQQTEQIKAILELVNMSAERNFMVGKADRQAHTQALTGLPNAMGYMRLVGQKYQTRVIDHYDAYYFNLKGYGLINKEFGQKEGDAILQRYVLALRGHIGPDEILGHLGGDNFVALVLKGERSEAFKKRLEGVETYGELGGERVPVLIPAVAGMMSVEVFIPTEQIISGPAVACSFAKRTHAPLVVLNDELNDQINRAKRIEKGFRKALANHEYTAFYQPKVDALTGELIGAEALIRWCENGRLVPPGLFVPVLEESLRITQLDLTMMEMVCADIAGWQEQGLNLVPISVNISRRDLDDDELFAKICDIIERYRVPKEHIIVELTESTTAREKERMIEFIHDLRDYGIKTSIDDFGTGYSSLSALRDMPVNEIKLDRSFINRRLDRIDEVLLGNIIHTARTIHIEVIQEGVETVEQKNFIVRLGCNRIQGFLYSKPLPKREFDLWMRAGKDPVQA